MAAAGSALPTLSDFLAAPLRAGAPDVHGPLAVFPLFGPDPGLEYVAFAEGVARGLLVKELEDGASVNDLVVLNPTDAHVLLYEGEEVLGAQQNRTFDVSVLVPAGESLRVPVSCVEHGRWDGSRHGEAFRPAPQAGYPALRRMKNVAAHTRLDAGMEARAEQGAVWDEVAAKSSRLGAWSPTSALHDVYEGRRDRLHAFQDAIPLHPGQTGALAAIGGRVCVLDHVSRPDVFAALHGPLVQGYALDALEAETTADAPPPVPPLAAATTFLAGLGTTRVTQHGAVGLGRDTRFATPRATGAGLVADDELVQLTAFAADGRDDRRPATRARIRRPSRRR
jgi:ARG and Rhodanese-Phosphatase-superfamily-associated Protein domain